MPTRLEININRQTAATLRYLELERGLSPADTIAKGAIFLALMDKATKIIEVDPDGTEHIIDHIMPEPIPDVYDF